jgi:hypothetical protein
MEYSTASFESAFILFAQGSSLRDTRSFVVNKRVMQLCVPGSRRLMQPVQCLPQLVNFVLLASDDEARLLLNIGLLL